jgi:hypothetical protein
MKRCFTVYALSGKILSCAVLYLTNPSWCYALFVSRLFESQQGAAGHVAAHTELTHTSPGAPGSYRSIF